MPRSILTRREFVRSTTVAVAGVTLPGIFTTGHVRAAEPKAKLKIWMHWDMEGTSGLFHEVATQFPGAVTACVKKAETFERATGPEPADARKLTAEKVAEAIEKLRTAKPAPYKPTLPMHVVLRYKEKSGADAAAKKPGVRRVDAHTVACEVQRQCDVVKWLSGTGVE